MDRYHQYLGFDPYGQEYAMQALMVLHGALPGFSIIGDKYLSYESIIDAMSTVFPELHCIRIDHVMHVCRETIPVNHLLDSVSARRAMGIPRPRDMFIPAHRKKVIRYTAITLAEEVTFMVCVSRDTKGVEALTAKFDAVCTQLGISLKVTVKPVYTDEYLLQVALQPKLSKYLRKEVLNMLANNYFDLVVNLHNEGRLNLFSPACYSFLEYIIESVPKLMAVEDEMVIDLVNSYCGARLQQEFGIIVTAQEIGAARDMYAFR